MRAAFTLLLVVSGLAACSWDYPVWPKSKKSDTPLFRFVVEEHFGAGYIDQQGRVVIPPQFMVFGNHGGDFFGGLARVTAKDKRDFYINSTGKPVAETHYLFAGDFSDGLARRWFSDIRKSGFVGRDGKVAIPPSFEGAHDFSEGLAPVRVSGRWGYVDRNGKVAIPAQFGFAGDFHDGHALVILNGPCQYVGYGPCEYPLNPPYTIPDSQPGSTKPAVLPRCRYSVIGKDGKVLSREIFPDAKHFSEGLAPVGDGRKWGFADYAGRVVIPLQFEGAQPFAEGLAAVRLAGKWGFIGHSGGFVIKPRFSHVNDFSEGMAVVIDQNFQYSFIGKNGERTIPGSFDGASGFVMGLAHVRMGRDYYSSRWSYINKSGKTVFTYFDRSPLGQIKK